MIKNLILTVSQRAGKNKKALPEQDFAVAEEVVRKA
jgi:hypothetical protein